MGALPLQRHVHSVNASPLRPARSRVSRSRAGRDAGPAITFVGQGGATRERARSAAVAATPDDFSTGGPARTSVANLNMWRHAAVMLNGRSVSPPGSQPATPDESTASRRHRAITPMLLVALGLASGAMLLFGLLGETADAPRTAGEPPTDPQGTLSITNTGPTVSPGASTPAPPGSTAPSEEPETTPRSTAPSEAAATTSPPGTSGTTPADNRKPSGTPSPATTTAPPDVAVPGAPCAPEGSRAATALGLSVVCATRPLDPQLRWRLI